MVLDDFRIEVRQWLKEHCPEQARGKGDPIYPGSKRPRLTDEVATWRAKLGSKGWTVPTWPKAYGGGGLTQTQAQILQEELRAIKARVPLGGMGISMIGPTLLEFGTEEQKRQHLPPIAMGEVSWCQGYSEPEAGSDLASLRTRAEDKGDFFNINGQKIWTSGADFADWIFMLVRTDFSVPKHEGISFMLMTMDQPGVRVQPIQLISGDSPFCETFFDNAVAEKSDLIGRLNRGWGVGKRLLQYERLGQGGLGDANARPAPYRPDLVRTAKKYIGVDSLGKIDDVDARNKVAQFAMNKRSFELTQERSKQENASGKSMGEATSIFKMYGASMGRDTVDLQCQLMGHQGYGWEGTSFSDQEILATRNFLSARAHTIYGGTNEVQLNIIAKRVLELPD
ncbi:MAG: acyl-CoA dehydrogenase family protein [Pseudomonadales bacterium]|nr:acyl-CoA dehydrogenase family protein [Pseudomonadales bacterium]